MRKEIPFCLGGREHFAARLEAVKRAGAPIDSWPPDLR
jgi:hypothetical protein